MINKISLNNTNSNNKQQYPNNDTNFKGVGEAFLSAVQLCETEPMVNVAVADLTTAIIPRTIIEGQTNTYAGFEAFRRESSGLIINCIIPSFIVLAIAKAIQGSIMGGDSKMADCWANEDTIKMVQHHWDNAKTDAVKDKTGKIIYEQGSKEAKVYNIYKKMLADMKSIDGDKEVDFSKFDFDDSIRKLTEDTLNPQKKAGFFSEERKAARKATKEAKKAADAAGKEYVASDALSQILHKTRAGENIKITSQGKGYFSQSLGDVLNHTPKLLRELLSGKFPDSKTFASKAKKLVTAKSLGGLAIILPLAISAQPINRWLTHKASGKSGAPIYNDFENAQHQELSPKEKSALFKQKLVSISSMVGVALLSIMKMPSLSMLKNITQFKSIFPSMDQARIISTATFSSRMAASQDKNDLREATYRDISLFCTFYFLGDYVAKGVATALEKTKQLKDRGIKLVNVLDKTPADAGILKKFWYWAKHTSLKSSAEVYGQAAKDTKYAKNMRSVCQLANLGFQLITLGIIIPIACRKKTEKEHAKELQMQKMEKEATKNAKAA